MPKIKIRVTPPADKVKVTFGDGDEYRYLATVEDTDGEDFWVKAVGPSGG